MPVGGVTPGFFSLAPASSVPEAGSPFEVTITALAGVDALDTAYVGAHCLTFTGPGGTVDGRVPAYPAQGPCASGSSVVFTDGLATG